MWKCLNCQEKNENIFKTCWQCESQRDGTHPAPAKVPAKPEPGALPPELTAELSARFEQMQLPEQSEELVHFLLASRWPFHGYAELSRERVLASLEKGFYTGSNHQSFWILGPQQEKWGMIRLFDLDDIGDGYPLFDLRIAETQRGKGLGKLAVRWLTTYLFASWPELDRIQGTTRSDNLGMRKVFRQCGYAKEGHYRKSWDGFDAIHYGILREDWQSGNVTPVNWHDEPGQ